MYFPVGAHLKASIVNEFLLTELAGKVYKEDMALAFHLRSVKLML